MREKLRQFMIGRYGVDDLSRVQIIAALVLLLVSTFLRVNILYWLGLALLIYSYFKIQGSGEEKQYEKTLGTAWYLPFFQMPSVQTDSPGAEGKRKDLHYLSEM